MGNSTWGLMGALFVVLTAAAYGYTLLFSGRAAMLHMGVFTATIMAANVAMIIIPNQKIVVADLKAGKPIFTGTVKSNTGKLISDKDTGLYDPSLEHTDYLVEGIVGTV